MAAEVPASVSGSSCWELEAGQATGDATAGSVLAALSSMTKRRAAVRESSAESLRPRGTSSTCSQALHQL